MEEANGSLRLYSGCISAWVGRRSSLEAARYVFHGYDMAEIGSRVVCLCTLAELGLKLPEPRR